MKLLSKNDNYLIYCCGEQFEALRQSMIWQQTKYTKNFITKMNYSKVTNKKESAYVIDSFRRWFKKNYFKTEIAALNHFSNEYGLGYVRSRNGNPTLYSIITPTGMTIGHLVLLKTRLGFSVKNIEFKRVMYHIDSEHDTNGDR